MVRRRAPAPARASSSWPPRTGAADAHSLTTLHCRTCAKAGCEFFRSEPTTTRHVIIGSSSPPTPRGRSPRRRARELSPHELREYLRGALDLSLRVPRELQHRLPKVRRVSPSSAGSRLTESPLQPLRGPGGRPHRTSGGKAHL